MRNQMWWMLLGAAGLAGLVQACTFEDCELDADCAEGEVCVIETGETIGTCTPAGGEATPDAGGGGGGGGSDTGGGGGTPPDCSANGTCNPACAPSADPDCTPSPACTCDALPNVCNVTASGSATPCACDPDCAARSACSDDDYCDTACPENTDPNCRCNCNYNENVCEARARGSREACICDIDCVPAGQACTRDSHCDSWCPSGVDPDCAPFSGNGQNPSCSCDWNRNVCEARARNTDEICACDPDCAGGLEACKSDGHCDTFCPAGFDPDCR
jgi:hypothetical protein